MPQKSTKTDGFKRFNDSLAAGNTGTLYIFHGEERYLLERSLAALRKKLCPDGLEGFNYKRYEGKGLAVDELGEAIDALPVFAERTLIEIHDFDIFKNDQKQKLAEMFSDLPEYVCVVFIFDIIAYKPDGRVKLDAELIKNADVVEFSVQDQVKLTNWIKRHFMDAGKNISTADAEYLAFITGGFMSTLHGEIGKTAAYAKAQAVTRADIDAVVTPALDAVAYKLADALTRRDHKGAMTMLDELFQMRESPHKLLFSISLKMRQLLAARVCLDNNSGRNELMEMCGIRTDYQAKTLMETARRSSLTSCRDAVLHCAKTALDLNSAPEPEARLIELVSRLALN